MDEDCVVIGAGVIGLTTGVVLAEAGHSVRIVTKDPPDRTTSMVAGALLGPVIPGPHERDNRWAQSSYTYFRALAADPATGVRVDRGRLVSNFPGGTPPWARDIPGYAECAGADRPGGFATAFWTELPVADMPRYLPYLVERFERAGGRIEPGTVEDLNAAADLAGVVVNCTGVAARQLVPDPTVTSAKGQHVIVRNPGLSGFCYEGGGDGSWLGWFVHGDRVLLGGIDVRDDWTLAPDHRATAEILARCIAAEPRLADAELLDVEVGLRPHRPTVRVEAERVGTTTIVHHYGHAGTGVLLSWGSAADVLTLVRTA